MAISFGPFLGPKGPAPQSRGFNLRPGSWRLSAPASRLVTRIGFVAFNAQLSRHLLQQRPLEQIFASAVADGEYDIILSSGFLAFANHSGFLKAFDEVGLKVGGIMGTSAGALAGSLYAAGYSPEEVATELSRVPPIQLLRICWQPWRGGLLSLDGVVERLRELLPPTFEDLEKEFAVGVVTRDGRHVVVDSGPLAEAVAASAAIPIIFAPVDIPGREGGPFKDGGMVDRIGLTVWRRHRQQQRAAARQGKIQSSVEEGKPRRALVHLISRSSPFSGRDNFEAMGEKRVTVVRSPKSGANFWSLGNYTGQMQAAYQRAKPAMQLAVARTSGKVPARNP